MSKNMNAHLDEKNDEVARRSREIFQRHADENFRSTDRLFAWVFIFQWMLGIVFSLFWSPYTWIGEEHAVHVHVWASIFLGGAIIVYPLYLIATRPGQPITRHSIAVAQALTSTLLIHLSGGRIETHFHVFGSLAFLASYRDWRVLITMSAIVAVDHLVRGIFWPQSAFGIVSVSEWRWLEHTAWVLFEDAFLIRMCLQSVKNMKWIARQQSELEMLNHDFELLVERKTAELAETNRKLSQSNQELENFATIASHDLQEPLRKIITFSSQLKSEYGNTLDPDALQYLERMNNASERMRDLINSLLSYSRVTRKCNPFQPSSLNEIMKYVSFDLETTAAEKHAVIDIQPNLPAIECDATQLHQLFLNLVNNGLKFQPADRKPVVRVFSRANDNPDVITLVVEDNGIGIEKEYHERIFGLFQRLHGRQEYSGSGIGLSVCKKIVERHNGNITVESEPGQFTRFVVTLPRYQCATDQISLAA